MKLKQNKSDKLNSLNAQIYGAEQQLIRRRLGVNKNGSQLLQHLQQRITEPASLGLAVGVGFIVAELTQHQPQQTFSAVKPSVLTEMTILSIAQSCIAFMHELYTVLPLILMAKS